MAITSVKPSPLSTLAKYRVRTGMLAWMLHRLSGLAIVAYLIIHVWGLQTMTDPAAYNHHIAEYHGAFFKVGEFLLLCGVVYHALNGLRIVLIDFVGWSPKQIRLFWTLGAVAAVLIIVGGYPSWAALVDHFAGH